MSSAATAALGALDAIIDLRIGCNQLHSWECRTVATIVGWYRTLVRDVGLAGAQA